METSPAPAPKKNRKKTALKVVGVLALMLVSYAAGAGGDAESAARAELGIPEDSTPTEEATPTPTAFDALALLVEKGVVGTGAGDLVEVVGNTREGEWSSLVRWSHDPYGFRIYGFDTREAREAYVNATFGTRDDWLIEAFGSTLVLIVTGDAPTDAWADTYDALQGEYGLWTESE